jgi:hypothetical protein
MVLKQQIKKNARELRIRGGSNGLLGWVKFKIYWDDFDRAII